MTKAYQWFSLWTAITVTAGEIQSNETEPEVVTCAERNELNYFQSFEIEEKQIGVRSPCHSCCCSNLTNQVSDTSNGKK